MPGFDGWKNLTDCGTRYDRRTPQAKAKRKQKAELKLKAKQNEDENKEEKQEKEDADSGLPGENDNPAASTAKNQKKRQQRETVEASAQTVESYPPQLLVANATAETEPSAPVRPADVPSAATPMGAAEGEGSPSPTSPADLPAPSSRKAVDSQCAVGPKPKQRAETTLRVKDEDCVDYNDDGPGGVVHCAATEAPEIAEKTAQLADDTASAAAAPLETTVESTAGETAGDGASTFPQRVAPREKGEKKKKHKRKKPCSPERFQDPATAQEDLD